MKKLFITAALILTASAAQAQDITFVPGSLPNTSVLTLANPVNTSNILIPAPGVGSNSGTLTMPGSNSMTYGPGVPSLNIPANQTAALQASLHDSNMIDSLVGRSNGRIRVEPNLPSLGALQPASGGDVLSAMNLSNTDFDATHFTYDADGNLILK